MTIFGYLGEFSPLGGAPTHVHWFAPIDQSSASQVSAWQVAFKFFVVLTSVLFWPKFQDMAAQFQHVSFLIELQERSMEEFLKEHVNIIFPIYQPAFPLNFS